MFEAVLKLLIEDKQRSDRTILYSQLINQAIYGSVDFIYSNFIKDIEPEYIADTTNAISITDGIYVQMGVELGL